jgi:hypothetical protein
MRLCFDGRHVSDVLNLHGQSCDTVKSRRTRRCYDIHAYEDPVVLDYDSAPLWNKLICTYYKSCCEL